MSNFFVVATGEAWSAAESKGDLWSVKCIVDGCCDARGGVDVVPSDAGDDTGSTEAKSGGGDEGDGGKDGMEEEEKEVDGSGGGEEGEGRGGDGGAGGGEGGGEDDGEKKPAEEGDEEEEEEEEEDEKEEEEVQEVQEVAEGAPQEGESSAESMEASMARLLRDDPGAAARILAMAQAAVHQSGASESVSVTDGGSSGGKKGEKNHFFNVEKIIF